MARGNVPPLVASAFMSARLTALVKPAGGVRGIATGTSFRRLVARTLARQFGDEVENACAPFQFAMSTRASTDCVGHAARLLSEADANATLLSVDGIGAYDYISRAAMLKKHSTLPRAKAMPPFVRMAYAQPSRYTWLDEAGDASKYMAYIYTYSYHRRIAYMLCIDIHCMYNM